MVFERPAFTMNSHPDALNRMQTIDASNIDLRETPQIDSHAFKLTLFTVPKPFGGATDVIQRNAIESWKQLAPAMDVLVLGDEPGIAETAAEMGVRHVPGLKRNLSGTPLLSSAFQMAHEHSATPLLMYCNCDVILEPSFLDAIECVVRSPVGESFVAFGRRLDVPVDWEIQFNQPGDRNRLRETVATLARRAPVVCKEYFVFPRTLFSAIPDFAVGRGNWDNWMVWHPRSQGVPVVDLSDRVQVIHQAHDYQHLRDSRQVSYVTGPEAKENQRLAGGRHMISGCSGTWRLSENSVERVRWPGLNWNFWRDLPRFAGLIAELFLKRR